MLIRCICSAALVAFAPMFASPEMARADADDGIVKFKSAYDMPETIKRIKISPTRASCSSTRSIRRSLPPTRASPCSPRRFSCSAIRPSARCS
jgi:hypothetical protein